MKIAIPLLLLVALAAGFSHSLHGQSVLDREGKLWATWGYNRAQYSNSTIRLHGEGFDITFHDAMAQDMPEEWDPGVYMNPLKLTIPQFNFRVGYFFTNQNSISFGWDHMKYRLTQHQQVRMTGWIDKSRSEEYAGSYDNHLIVLAPDLLKLEHSDGFNFVNVTVDHLQSIWMSKNGKHSFNFMGALSAGAMIPWTESRLFDNQHRNRPHLSGYALSGQLGVRFEFFRHGFVQFRFQHGYANLPDVMIEDLAPSRAEHSVWFTERSVSLGFYVPFKGKK